MNDKDTHLLAEAYGKINEEDFRWSVEGLSPNPNNDPIQTVVELGKLYNKSVWEKNAKYAIERLKDKWNIDMNKLDLNDTSNGKVWDTIIHVILSIYGDAS